ncbi:DUF3857 domain-containing transglutaminase family protein [Rhizobium paknamense]|uniref:Transglutaminase-like putative cysteine protease n=1 Tax=Rhizobium paknamense TaxID=1206817 RepID=A0ABU0I9Q5_9HYPH|nr:DUF3857 and transglutaminase domain-containing protein [Rhizobium paknamense]MDQ0454358.1 transglutaminase-like putative cysteine protease [Rhizobium paknamense]
MPRFHPCRALPSLLFAILLGASGSAVAAAEGRKADEGNHVVWSYDIHGDQTFDLTETLDVQPVPAGGLAGKSQYEFSFQPENQKLEVAEAWVVTAGGQKLTVPASDIFIRPSQQARDMPGFTSEQTMSVIFPQVSPGAKVHLVWHFQQAKPGLFGINMVLGALTLGALHAMDVHITVPQSVPLRYYADPGVKVEDTQSGDLRHIDAAFRDIPALRVPYGSINTLEYRPKFMATTLTSLTEYGARIVGLRPPPPSKETTAALEGLVTRIAGGKKGLEAAAAIHGWIQQNIAYKAIFLNANDGWVEHSVDKILANGFGDCKDQAALMQALLAVKGIRSEPVVVNWGDKYTPYPLPLPIQFNHVILYLPDYDVFDNPDDQQAAFGALNESILGKQGVVLSSPSRVITLPQAKPDDFTIQDKARLNIDANGNLAGAAVLTISQPMAPSYRGIFIKGEPQTYLENILTANGQLGEGRFIREEPKDWHDPLTLTASWVTHDYVDLTEPDIFLPLTGGFDPNYLTRFAFLVRPDVTTAPIMVNAVHLSWHFDIPLPPGTSVKRLPQPVHVATPAGHFDMEVKEDQGLITVTRDFVSNRVFYGPRDYPEIQPVLTAAVKAGRAFAVLQHAAAKNFVESTASNALATGK